MKNGNILVVDDNDDHRTAIQYLLEKQNYCVIPAENGESGLRQLYEHDDIQVLISDLAMLGVSGVQLLEEIKDRKQPLRRIVLRPVPAGDLRRGSRCPWPPARHPS